MKNLSLTTFLILGFIFIFTTANAQTQVKCFLIGYTVKGGCAELRYNKEVDVDAKGIGTYRTEVGKLFYKEYAGYNQSTLKVVEPNQVILYYSGVRIKREKKDTCPVTIYWCSIAKNFAAATKQFEAHAKNYPENKYTPAGSWKGALTE